MRNPKMAVSLLLTAVIFAACGADSGGTTTLPDTSETTTTSEGGSEAPAVVRIAHVPAIDLWTAYVALEQGYFADEGVEVEMVSMASGADVIEALIGGSVEMAASGMSTLVNAINQGAAIKGIISAENGAIGQIALSEEYTAEKGLTADSAPDEFLSALEGGTIATNLPGGSLYGWTRMVLERSGLDPDSDVTMQPLEGGGAMLAAFEAGRVDAFAHVPPVTSQAASRLGALLLDMNDVPEATEFKTAPSDIYVASQAMIDESPEVMAAVSRAVLRAWDYIVNNREAAEEILGRHLEDLGSGYTDLDFGNLEREGVLISESQFEAGMVIAEAVIGEDVDLTYSEVFDATFAEQAALDLGLGN